MTRLQNGKAVHVIPASAAAAALFVSRNTRHSRLGA